MIPLAMLPVLEGEKVAVYGEDAEVPHEVRAVLNVDPVRNLFPNGKQDGGHFDPAS